MSCETSIEEEWLGGVSFSKVVTSPTSFQDSHKAKYLFKYLIFNLNHKIDPFQIDDHFLS
jgi:hypothetical protein